MHKKTGRSIYIIAFLLFFGGIAYLTYSGLIESSVYFLNVGEALDKPAESLRSARLFGSVAQEDLARHEGGFGVTFRLKDKDDTSKTLLVNYPGAIPDTFEAGAEVIVEGGLTEDGLFQAKTLITKCPSKYQKEKRS